jgi:phosphate uptake regulator
VLSDMMKYIKSEGLGLKPNTFSSYVSAIFGSDRLKGLSSTQKQNALIFLASLSRVNFSNLDDLSKRFVLDNKKLLEIISMGLDRTSLKDDLMPNIDEILNSLVKEFDSGEDVEENVSIDPQKHVKIFTYILRNLSKKVHDAILNSPENFPAPEGETDNETDAVLKNIGKAVSSKDVLSDPQTLVSTAKIPDRFISKALFSLIDTDAQALANQVLKSLGAAEDEDIPKLAENASNLIVNSMSNLLSISDVEVEQDKAPDDYYMKNDEALSGTPAKQDIKVKELDSKNLLEITLILAISHVLYYLRP